MQPTLSIPSQDRLINLLLAVHNKRSIQEIEQILDVSRQIVQRHLQFGLEAGYIQKTLGKTGRKAKNRGRELTESGKEYLRDRGHEI